MTAEQKARDMLERIGVSDAQSFSAGDLVELANLIDSSDALARDAGRYRKMRAIALDNGASLEGEVAIAQLDFTGNIETFDNAVDRLGGRC